MPLPPSGHRWPITWRSGISDDRPIRAAARARHRPFGAAVTSNATTPRYRRSTRFAVPRRLPRSAPAGDADRSLPPELVDRVVTAFGLGRAGPTSQPALGGRADNVVVETDDGVKLLKRYKVTVSGATIHHEHSILRHLAAVDFPSPRLTAAGDGTTAKEIDGRWFAAFDYLSGYFHYNQYFWSPGGQLDLVGLSGQALASLHQALVGFTPDGAHPTGFVSLDGPRSTGIDWYLEALERARDVGPGLDPEASAPLRQMLDANARSVGQDLIAVDRALEQADLPRQVIHGDYGPYNLLLRKDERVIILDFELARMDWRVADVAKSLQQFGMNRYGLRPRRIARFVSSYRAVNGLSQEERRMIPSVWRFLTLRRIIVCWSRMAETGDQKWLAEAEQKLSMLNEISTAADKLSQL